MNTSRFSAIPLLLSVLMLGACGGGGGGDDEENNEPGAPVANAGEDQTVQTGDTVEIYSWDSVDEDGWIESYSWEQTGGTAVVIDDPGYGIATFVAPPSGESDLELTFRLTVVDDEGKEDTDTVVVTVEAQGSTPDGFGLLHNGVIKPENFTLSNGKAFFVALDGDEGPLNAPNSDQLWITDGTFSGTRMLHEMSEEEYGGDIRILSAFGNGVVFTGYDDTHSGALWFADGTADGTYLIKDITTTASENIQFVGVGGNYFYFMANDGVHGIELWASDGTPEGTHMLVDRNPAGDSRTERAEVATYYNGAFYLFLWHYETGTFDAYPQLYRTDGTAGSLEQLTNNVTSGSVLLDYDMIVYKDRLYFSWHSPANGKELWVTDGTAGGTQLFKNIAPDVGGAYSGWTSNFHILDDKLLFFAYEDGTGAHKSLWSSDGTEAGTQLVYPVDLYVGGNSQMVLMNGVYYFPGRDHADLGAWTLWTTDGTAGGTYEVHSVQPPSGGGFPKMVVAGNKLIFRGTDEVHGFEPWVSDGTAAGTFMLKDINPDMGDGNGSFTTNGGVFTARGNMAYFVAGLSEGDFQLFETDGTSAGTKIIAPADATVTTNPMGQAGFINQIELPAPTLLGNTLLFNGSFHGNYRLYKN